MKRECQALDQYGKKCRRSDVKPVQYHGENELYGYLNHGNEPTWVRVYLCSKHRKE